MNPLGESLNPLGQPIGNPLPGWRPPAWPSRVGRAGQFCALEPLDPERHGARLYEELSADATNALWTYLPYGPFADVLDYEAWLRRNATTQDPLFFTILDAPTRRAIGLQSYLRITPEAGSIEVGHLQFSPRLQRTPAGTEALWFLLSDAFAMGYRRCEWKCDALNAKSRAAAERLGFQLEGVFRQATVYKGRNRDTAWYSIIDSEWPALDRAFRGWLAEDNFDSAGRQKRRLAEFRAEAATSGAQ